MKAQVTAIERCGQCPWADDGEMIGDGEWTCHGKLTKEGWARHISQDKPPAVPPKWCPLRTAPILVKLVVPRGRRGKN